VIATVATAGLVPGLLFAIPANAEDAYGYVSAGHTVHGAQQLAVSTGVQAPTVQQSKYSSIDAATAYSEGAVAPGARTNVAWAQLVLTDGGWPVSANNTTVMVQWMDSENGAQDWWNRNNPLNDGYGSGGGAGLGSYPNLLVAAQDAATNLHRNSGYAAIVSDLAASAPAPTTATAIWDSPWAGGHYDYGRIWHAVNIATVAAPASAW
jgi:hypothetical protein